MPRWFLLLNGCALLVMGAALLAGRARQPGSWVLPAKILGAAWALLCCAVGVGLILMGEGYLPQPGRPVSPPQQHRGPIFPTDR